MYILEKLDQFYVIQVERFIHGYIKKKKNPNEKQTQLWSAIAQSRQVENN